jgi:hypothetical protein
MGKWIYECTPARAQWYAQIDQQTTDSLNNMNRLKTVTLKVAAPKVRNPVIAALAGQQLMPAAGVHRRTRRAERRAAKMSLQRSLRSQNNEPEESCDA